MGQVLKDGISHTYTRREDNMLVAVAPVFYEEPGPTWWVP